MHETDPYIEFAKFYDILNFGTYRKYIKMILKALQDRCANLKNLTLADIGGGTGAVAYRIYKHVRKIILVEPSKSMLEIAKGKLKPQKHKNIEFKQGGFPNCGLEKESVDVIISINDPFQYLLKVEEQVPALMDVYQSLKPGGLLLIDNKNFFSIIKRYRTPEEIQVKLGDRKYTSVSEHEVFPLKEQWIHTYHFFVENLATGDTKSYQSKHVLKMVSPTEMRLLFDKIGFTNIEITTHPLEDKHEASRIWCFARKS
jgi:ubiquinone/menaquinone biosynthesis C-methylase UbiE